MWLVEDYLRAVQAIHGQWPWFWPLVAAVLGAVLGSFINCARYRLPKGLSLRNPPSHCPACDEILGIADLVPIASWLWLRGKCRYCKASIPATSLIIEVFLAATAAIWVVLAF